MVVTALDLKSRVTAAHIYSVLIDAHKNFDTKITLPSSFLAMVNIESLLMLGV